MGRSDFSWTYFSLSTMHFFNLIVGLSITHSVILMFQAIWLVRHLGVIEWITRYPNKTNLAGVNLPFEVLIKSTLKGFLHLMIAIRWIFFFCKSRFQTIIVNWKHASLFRGVPHVFFSFFPRGILPSMIFQVVGISSTGFCESWCMWHPREKKKVPFTGSTFLCCFVLWFLQLFSISPSVLWFVEVLLIQTS